MNIFIYKPEENKVNDNQKSQKLVDMIFEQLVDMV